MEANISAGNMPRYHLLFIIYVHPLMKSHIGSTTEKKKENKLDCGHFRKNQQNLGLPGLPGLLSMAGDYGTVICGQHAQKRPMSENHQVISLKRV